MALQLLIIIYVAFISLGLPDSLFGVSWPVIRLDFNAPLGLAGIISMIVSGGTIISSYFSGIFLKRIGTGKVTAISVFLTAVALMGFSFSPSVLWLFFLAIPLGIGAGAVDAGLNAYVAAHYKSYHMSWLHCFWGIGAMTSPIIISQIIHSGASWRRGYFIIAILQFALVAVLILSLPLWNKMSKINEEKKKITDQGSLTNPVENVDADDPSVNVPPLKQKGVKMVLLSFLLYCAIESTIGLWSSSFLVNVKGSDVAIAARWVSLFFGGITFGRFVSGFLTLKLNNKRLIRLGEGVLLGGALLLILPLPDMISNLGLILAGLGCAPIYPCMLHETPARFGAANSERLMGIQMAIAYTGSTFFPSIFGFTAGATTMAIFPAVIAVLAGILLFSSELTNRFFQRRSC
ncbi:MAG: transporter [Herbinix sp.]|jgi:fucose permease|nr:transporter [Herbinix sp.]